MLHDERRLTDRVLNGSHFRRARPVRVQLLQFSSHTAEVTASSLFEAVAQGLSEGIDERFGIVKVSVAEVHVEHQVKIAEA